MSKINSDVRVGLGTCVLALHLCPSPPFTVRAGRTADPTLLYDACMTSLRWFPSVPSPARRLPAAMLTALVLLPILATLQASAQSPAELPPADLPVTRLVATTSGLATFEHAGTVVNDQELVLSVPQDAMDDLLQSLVLQDFGGGSIRPVRYDARDALGRILASYAFDLRNTPSLASLLAQARGEELLIEGPTPARGTLLAVERVDAPDEAPAWYLTLVGKDGLLRLPLAEVSTVQFVREELQQELNAALAALSRERGETRSEVRIRFEGEGERQVRIAYVREMPIWKTSYRLVVGDDGTADLQGWAILDNPTDLDLVDVEATFLAGRPISFVTELYRPVWVERPRVSPETAAQIVPEADSGAFAAEGEAVADAMPAPSARSGAGAALMAAPAAPELSNAGVEAATTGIRTGSAYAYRVDEPITVGRHASAMVPIVQATIPAQRLTVYDPSTAGGAPLRAVRIVNGGEALLAAGTVTLYDAGGFAGNARMSDLESGGERLLRFAGDLGVRVERETTSADERVVAVRLEGALLVSEVRRRTETNYRIARDDAGDRLLVIEQPAPDGWELVQPSSPAPDRSEGAWRFGVALGVAIDDPAVPVQARCEGEEACLFEVAVERTERVTVHVADLALDRIVVLLENVDLSASDRAVLERIAELQRRVTELDRAINDQQARRDDIHREQDRIRSNMSVLDRNSNLYRRYLSELGEQEDELDVVLTAIERFRAERSSAQAELSDTVRQLEAR